MRERVAGVLILAIAASLAIAANKPDFTGKWKLIVNRSNFGGAEKPVSMTIESTLKSNVMHSVQTEETAQGPQTSEFDWYMDGQRHSTEKPMRGYSLTRWDNNTLINERRSDDGSYRETIRMTLSSDGKTATEDIQSKGPNGSNHEKLVFERQ